jgi:hypothetical protein
MRSVLAVVVGYVVLATLVAAKFAFLQRFVPTAFSDPGWLALVVLTDGLSAMLGGYVLAVLVRTRQVAHALALVAILVPLGIANALMNAGQEPIWFQLATLAAMLSALPIGAWLRAHQQVGRACST